MVTARQQRANRLFLAHQDMDDAGNYLLGLGELEKVPAAIDCEFFQKAAEAIFLAAVVVYARPFMESKSKGYADERVRPKFLFQGRPEHLALHTIVIDCRNQAAAHADWTYHQTELIDDGAPSGTLRKVTRPHYRRNIEISDFFELIQFVHRGVLSALWDLDEESKRSEAHTLAVLPSRHKSGARKKAP